MNTIGFYTVHIVKKKDNIRKGRIYMYDNNYPNDYSHSDAANQNTPYQHNTGNTYQGSSYQGSTYQNASTQGSTYQGTQNTGSTYQSGQSTGSTNSYQSTQSTGSAYQTGGTYSHNAGSYQYGNTYPNSYAQAAHKKEKKRKTGNGYFKKALACVGLGLFFGVFAGLGFYVVETVSGMNTRAETQQVSEAVPDNAVTAASNEVQSTDTAAMTKQTETATTVVTDVTNVVSGVMPSIVSINNHFTETISYFGQAMTSEGEGSGSGIIVGKNDSELLIVTNYHVIEGADKLTVKFVEDSEAEAFVKGTDADMDLAVIAVPVDSIDAATLNEITIATLGDSDSLTVGEPAIAIGNSLGYGQSVTTGVISALNRSIELSDGSTGTFIQTDAAINPGNSGGALLNLKGEVIGINSNKIGGSTVEGMGYAIPISAANPIIADLMLKETKNRVAEEERGYLGISGITVTQDVVETYGMPEGVYVVQVYENTPSAQAGLQKGDIITEFAGQKISSMDELQEELQYHAKGDQVEMKIMTVGNGGYESKTLTITLGDKVQ